MLSRNLSAVFLASLSALTLPGCDDPTKHSSPATSTPTAAATVHLADIAEGKTLIGYLGKPIFTVVKIRGVFTDMTYTRSKGNDGRIALKILSVEEIPLTTEPCFDFVAGELLTDDGTQITNESGIAKSCIGKQFTGYAYEQVNSAGTPSGVFRYEPMFATTSPYLKSKIILVVNEKDAAAQEKRFSE